MQKIITFSLPLSANNSVHIEEENSPVMFPYLHQHEEMQMTLILRGEGTALIGNSPFDYVPSTIFLIKGNTPHVFKSKPEFLVQSASSTTRAIHVYFNYQRLISHLKNLPEFKPIRAVISRVDHGFIINKNDEAWMANRILALRKEIGLNRFADFVSLLNFICEKPDSHYAINSNNLNVSLDVQEGAKWNRIYRYVLTHFSDDISLKDVADIANLTPQAFCKYFKKRTRKTFNSFLNEIRIKEAITQMTSENFLGISQTAYSTGFKSAVHFNRTFKKVTGSSPSGYLKHHYTIQQRFV
ncbi:AraC family transcriptional regulator [Olivibacter sp. XZL3]|uniref:AraC family transcriptional regulator n=1 Tax=Olivibacter sp. XZL3 TaxID=1735116 RepID=UPI00106545D2|nr:AraC family transcriptional regulator [Olivibacter sp. XZL3]